MKYQTIYVLHKQGADSHYTALDFLVKNHSGTLKYREFSVFTKIFKGLRSFDLKVLKKQGANIAFLANLLVSRNKKVVLGIAPFDHKLLFLLKILKHHTVYYHTSWAHWDRSFHPKTKKNSEKVFEAWRYFLEEKCSHIFSVNQKGKEQLLANYNIPSEKINIVYHSLAPEFSGIPSVPRKKNSFIYVGRLVPQKGLREVLGYFTANKEASLTIIGKGPQSRMVEDYAQQNNNIFYIDYLGNKNELKNEFAGHQYLLLNSKRKKNWEELFGMVIIEAMSQGTIPVASSHSGPSEILSGDTGFLFEEGKFSKQLDDLLQKQFDSDYLSQNCIMKSREYQPEILAENWKAILT